ncbi:hypothetical protein D3C72_1525380 [compost metagenome]
MHAREQGDGGIVRVTGAAVVELELVDCQGGAQAVVEPVTLHTDFFLFGQLGAQVVDVGGHPWRDADQTATDRRERLAPGGVERVVLQRRPDHTEPWAGAVAVTVFGDVLELVGRVDLEGVVAHTGQQLPLIVQAQLVLEVDGAAFNFSVRVAGNLHASGVDDVAVGVVQVQPWHGAVAR